MDGWVDGWMDTYMNIHLVRRLYLFFVNHNNVVL